MPLVPVLIFKLDVSGAFTLVWLRPIDAGKVATDCSTEAWGLEASDEMTAISETLEFGGCNSPGEWVPWPWTLKEAHARTRPKDTKWNGSECFDSSYLVDDQSVVETLAGVRPWVSRRSAKGYTAALLGEGANNDDKGNIEGEPATSQIVFGLTFETTQRTVGMPEPKLIKAQYIFGDPELDYGIKYIKVHTLQVLRGNGEWFSIVQPSIKPWLKVIDEMLKGVKVGQTYVYLTTDNEELWREFEEMIESFRVMVARPELWDQDFTVSLANLLTPEERMAIPGELSKVVWCGGDATLLLFCFIDWTASLYFILATDGIFLLIGKAAGTEDRKLIIAVAELLCIVIGAIIRGPN